MKKNVFSKLDKKFAHKIKKMHLPKIRKGESMSAKKIATLLCLWGTFAFLISIIFLDIIDSINFSDILIILFLLGIYLAGEIFTTGAIGTKKHILYLIQVVVVIIKVLIFPLSAFVMFTTLGPLLLIYGVALFSKKNAVYIIGFIIYLISYTLFIHYNGFSLKTITMIASFAIIFMISFAYSIILDVNNIAVEKYLDELDNTNKRIVSLTESSQKEKIAGAFHDTLAQGVASLIMRLDIAYIHMMNDNNDKAKETLLHTLTQSRLLMGKSKAIMDDLKNIADENNNFVSEITLEISKISQEANVEIEHDIEQINITSLPLKEHLFRIIQESLKNAIHHSSASKVSIHLKLNSGKLILEIDDNGRGYDVDSLAGKYNRYGVIDIKERAKFINADLQINSKLGKGTKLILTKKYTQKPTE